MEEEEMKTKPFYKKWWVWLIAGIIFLFIFIFLIVIVIVMVALSDDEPNEVGHEEIVVEEELVEEDEVEKIEEEEETEETEEVDGVPREHRSALNKAELYANSMDMSKADVYDQLVSEHGEGFPKEAAQYAIDNIEADWKENALKKAETYAEMMDMSDSAIYDHLISEHGEQFTEEEAQYAIDNL